MYAGSSSPFDFLLFFDKQHLLVGIECKQIRSDAKSFSFSRVSDDQEEGLKKINDLDNGIGVLAVNFRALNSKKGRTFLLKADKYFEYKEKFLNNEYDYRNTKSFPLDFLEKKAVETYRRGTGWDLDVIKEEF